MAVFGRSTARSLAVAIAFLLAREAAAERLPWQRFTSASGLAGDAVRCLLLDSRGFLWIGTSSGLSRFDGREFRNYDTAQGLPSPRIEALAETPDGSIWVGTGEGLARIEPGAVASRRAFRREAVAAELNEGVSALRVDRDGALLVGHGHGLMRLEIDGRGALSTTAIEVPERLKYDSGVVAIAESADRTLWMATSRGVLRRRADGAEERLLFPSSDKLVSTLASDRQGRLWAASGAQLFVWSPEAVGPEAERELAVSRLVRRLEDLPLRPGELVEIDPAAGLRPASMTAIVEHREGFWVASRSGLFGLLRSGPRWIGTEHGLPESHQSCALEDAEGTLWLGTESRGLSRLPPSGFFTYSFDDGLVNDRVSSIFESPPGELYVATMSRDLHYFRGGRFVEITPRRLFETAISGWGWNEYIQRDRGGRLWYPTTSGLFRFAATARPEMLRESRPERHWRGGQELPGGSDVFRLYEDRKGDFWISYFAPDPLLRLRGGEHPEIPAGFIPSTARGAPSAFAEDAGGALWLGFYGGGLGRLRDGAWRYFGKEDGTPPGLVSDLLVDRRGRLWISTHAGGVAVIEDPLADSPGFRRYTSADGLSTDSTRCIAEDGAGRIYVGTSRGIDRLDPATGHVRAFSSDDGLPNDMVRNCYTASDGELWFGTLHGLARYRPPAVEPRTPPRVWISGLRIAGRSRAVPERGVESIEGLALAPADRAMEIEVVALGLSLGRNLLIQHRVNGGEWSEPNRERRLQLASLAPGSYRVELRATTRDGLTSPRSAVVAFVLPPPFYRRPVFVVLVAAALFGAFGAAMRARARRLLAIERTRTRIASDLHDDVGASVSRIGLLGELARQRLRGEPAAAEEYLEEIGSEARELADATSDIVWAVDPRRDDLGSLVVRLRRFAEDLMEAKEIDLDFEAPPPSTVIRLAPEVRRALYLALKEAIHNVAKHSGAKSARIEIRALPRAIEAEVADDGRGIAGGRAEEAAREGRHGLTGLVERAAGVGGTADVESGPGKGTRVRLSFPWKARIDAPSHRDARRGPGGG